MTQSKAERYEQIDRTFIDLQENIDLDNYLGPINRASELARFKEEVDSGRICNPQFEYDPLPDVHESELVSFMETLDPSDPIETLYREAVSTRLGEIRCALTHSASVISAHTSSCYGVPDQSILDVARKNLTDIHPDQRAYTGSIEGRIYHAEELADICRTAMTNYGFDWKVVVKAEMGAKAAVDNLIREFWIRADVRFHESLVKMMVVHEIGTHILRSENGYAQPLKLFGRGLAAYQFTEEGLAEYAEERTGALLEDTIYRISGRVIGVHMALTGSFWDVYCALKDQFDTDMAFDIAQRAKLGIRDTSQPGSYTKDYTYLAGLLAVRSFFGTADAESIDALLAGKVGFHHLDTVRQLQKEGYLVRPRAYPEWM